MSGILDNKRRVLDVIITQEGKRQIATGDLKIESFSFTDNGVRYAPDILSGSFDATSTIYLEACNLPQDSITFESNEQGHIQPFKNNEGIQVIDGQLIQYDETDDVDIMQLLKGRDFEVSGTLLLTQTLENFKKLQVISTKDDLFDTDGFGVGNSNVEFLLTDQRPITKKTRWSSNVNKEESLFNDPRLSRAINFQYLPPINKTEEIIDKTDYLTTKKFQLGEFPKLGKTNINEVTYEQLNSELGFFSSMGYEKIIKFDPTSKYNNLMLQVFEKRFNQLSKMEIIDFGRHKTADQNYPFAHIFFVGKLFTDDNDTHTFAHLFTLVFEE